MLTFFSWKYKGFAELYTYKKKFKKRDEKSFDKWKNVEFRLCTA